MTYAFAIYWTIAALVFFKVKITMNTGPATISERLMIAAFWLYVLIGIIPRIKSWRRVTK